MEKSPAPIATKEMSLKRKASIEVSVVNNKPEDETKAEKPEILDVEPNKKIIKLSELMTNMDPLEYFSRCLDIPEMIFQHLSGKDLIAASEVSSSYYNFIASSKVLMQKIKVVFDRDLKCELVRIPEGKHHRYIPLSTDLMEIKIGFHDKCATQLEDFNLLKSSSRLYQNIEVRRRAGIIKEGNGNERKAGDYVTNSELDFFYSRAHEWKNVSLDNVYFREKLDVWKLLSAIEATVESISVADFGYLSFKDRYSENESFEVLKFPKLKKLKMTFAKSSSFLYTWARFFLNSVAIEELDLGDLSAQLGEDILIKMLQNFDKLTKLNIDSFITNRIFEDESWRKFQFKLKSLAIVANLSTNSIKPNFRNFLKSQSDCLESLMCPRLDIDRETHGVIMKMPKLKNLKCYQAFPENEVPIIISNSITELTLIWCANAASLKFLLDSMPKVTNFTLRSIDEEDFKILKSMKRKFEKLKVIELKGVDRKEIEKIMTENYTSLEIVKSI